MSCLQEENDKRIPCKQWYAIPFCNLEGSFGILSVFCGSSYFHELTMKFVPTPDAIRSMLTFLIHHRAVILEGSICHIY